jgi:Flp pilus assembly protein TadG
MNTQMRDTMRERGQVLVVFTLALVAIVAMVGLVLDGGSTFVQRRDQQNVADAAALAGAYAYLNSGTSGAATTAATQIAATNGYSVDADGVAVSVTVAEITEGTTVQVSVTKPHRNSFSGLVGFPSWDVTTTATAITGPPNVVEGGAMPIIFNIDAWNPGNQGEVNKKAYDEPGGGNEDVPQGDLLFNWTIFCTANGNPCNANSDGVSDLIHGDGNGNGGVKQIFKNDLIGPLNAGSHTTLFDDLAGFIPGEWVVSIVDDNGAMLGWAKFHLTASLGGSTKQIEGYFEAGSFNDPPLSIRLGGGRGSSVFGANVVQLIN